jgi:hypothetical protein
MIERRKRIANHKTNCHLLSHRRPEFLDVSRRELRARKAARSAETICVTAGEILRAFTPTECANHS